MKIETLLPIITLCIGAIIGFISNIYIKNKEAKLSITNKILDQYFLVRNELCKELSILSTLKNNDEANIKLFVEARDKISRIYFENYDFLPKEVVDELNCLFVCLSDSRNRIFRLDNGKIVAISENELQSFINRISIVENFKYSALFYLHSENQLIKRTTSVKCQTRSVLVSLNRYFTMKHLLDWINVTTKKR